VRGGVWLKAIFHRKLTQLQYCEYSHLLTIYN
jgi:hypothetical protein